MTTRECDELGSNLFEAEQKWDCRLLPETAQNLISFVSERYGKRDFEYLLEQALDVEGVYGDTLRHGYKMALGLFFANRRHSAREAFFVPFAPR